MASLMVPDNTTQNVQYPDAPYDLADDEADEWRAIVRSMHPDHFTRGNFPLLAQLCRHICNSRRVAQLIEACVKSRQFSRKEYMSLLQMQATESAAIMRLSRSMRLTQQARIEPLSAKLRPRKTTPNPWERDD